FAQDNDYASFREAGIAEYLEGHYQQAEPLLHKAIGAARRSGNAYGAALSYSALGDVYQAEGRFANAIEAYREGLSLTGRGRLQSHAAAIMWRNLGSALTAQAQYPDAIKAFKEAAKTMKVDAVNSPALEGQILNALGVVYFHQGKMDKAAKT